MMRLEALGVGLTLALAALAPGCFTAIRPYAIENSAALRPSPLAFATISVAGEYERDVEVAVDVLRRTGVFGTVVRDQGQRSDLNVNVLSSDDSIKCGTPQMATVFTLGLVPTGNAHHALLALEFSGQGTRDPVVIERDVYAQTTHGLWALFLRVRREWTRPNWGKDPAGLAVALRGDLLANEEDLVGLARSPTLLQGPRQVGSQVMHNVERTGAPARRGE